MAQKMKRLFYWATALSLPIATLAILLIFFTVDAPFSDDYDAALAYLLRPFPERLFHLADFHNEHRIATARIVFELIYWMLGRIDFQACMYIGSVFLLGYGLLLMAMYKNNGDTAKLYYVPCVWVVVSVLNWDNICWAMTSVSNIQVWFWTLCAIVAFVHRKSVGNRWIGVIGGISCAVLATFSTGGGVFSWFGLLFVLFHEWLIKKGSWSNARRSCSRFKDIPCQEFFIVIVMFVICTAVYLRGMDGTRMQETPAIMNMSFFFLSFIGAIIPIFSVSVIVGALVICAIVILFVTLPRNTNTIALALLVCLVLSIGAATPFRAAAMDSALPGRYRIIPISIMVTLLAAYLPFFRFKSRTGHFVFSITLSASVIAYLAAFSSVSLPSLMRRNDAIRTAMATWTTDTDNIEYENDNGQRFSALLKEAYLHGIYSPYVVRKSEGGK